MASSLQAWQRVLGNAAAGGEAFEIGGLVGSIAPIARSRSILNAVAGPRGLGFSAGLLDEIDARYRSAGIDAWGVWVHEDDPRAGKALRDAGLVVDSRPTAMAIDLAELADASHIDGVSVERCGDLAALAQVMGAGYGFPSEFLTHGLPGLLDDGHGWLASVDGEPASALVLVYHGGDAGVYLVATAPELRGRGAAGAALHRALLQARAEGCTTSTLQASEMGRSVYARLGYSDLGAYHLWERRRPAQNP
jgi:GNAT superfamily N-acetyltransferase